MNARLAALALRRTAGPVVIAALLLAAWSAWSTPAAGALHDAEALRGLWIGSAWSTLVVLVAPLLVLHAALARPAREAAWVESARIGPAGAARSAVAGAVLAALLVAGAWSAAFLPRMARTGDPPVPALVGRAPGPAEVLVDARAPLSWSSDRIPGEAASARLELSLELSPGGGSDVLLCATRGAERREARAHLAPRGGVEVALPPGSGAVAFELSLPETGARGFVLGPELTLWRPAPAASAARGLAARAALALAAWAALAVLLASWLRPVTTVFLLLALWVPAWSGAALLAWLPGADLFAAIALAEAGRAPAPVGLRGIAAASACVAAALVLAPRRARPRA